MTLARAIWTAVDIVAAMLREPRPAPRRMPMVDTVKAPEQNPGVLYLVPKPAEPAYDPSKGPGHWEHRSGDCDVHGVNVAHARPYKGSGAYRCCACLLGEPGQARAAGDFERMGERARAAREYLGWAE